jgi:hypothetical protein
LNVLGDGGPISIPPDHWGYHPAGLQSMGEDLYVETASSGTAGVNTPGTTTKTTKLLNQGYNEHMKSCEREFESKRGAKSLSRKEPQIPDQHFRELAD